MRSWLRGRKKVISETAAIAAHQPQSGARLITATGITRVTGGAVNIPFTVSGHHRSRPSGTLCCVRERERKPSLLVPVAAFYRPGVRWAARQAANREPVRHGSRAAPHVPNAVKPPQVVLSRTERLVLWHSLEGVTRQLRP
jgi:hypothetical protein